MSEDEEVDSSILELMAASRTTAVPPEFLAEIGRVVANFALLEYEFYILIHGLLGTRKEISRIVTSELSFRNLLGLSASLVKEIHGEEEAERFKETLKLASEAEEERNRIIHSVWGGGGSGNVVRSKHTARRAKGLSFQREEYSQEDLSATARKISRVIFCVERFRESLGYSWVF